MIYINDKLRISKLDDYNLQLETYREVFSKKNNERTRQWICAGYYSNLKAALKGALTKSMFDAVNDTGEIEDLIRRLDKAEADIVAAVDAGIREYNREIKKSGKQLAKIISKSVAKIP